MRLPLALPYTLVKGTNQPLPNSITVPITRTVAFSSICQTSIQPLRLLFLAILPLEMDCRIF